jgi:hypothetical protein
MTEMILIAAVVFGVVAVLYGIYGSLTAGSGWKIWFLEQALPLYGVMLVALVGLVAILSTVVGRAP